MFRRDPGPLRALHMATSGFVLSAGLGMLIIAGGFSGAHSEVALPAQPPAPAPAAAAHDRDQAVLQHALGSAFAADDGMVALQSDSPKAAELPSGAYTATAELTAISAGAFHAACDGRTGLTACETRTLPDNQVVRLRSWADRDTEANKIRGESAVYLQRKDSSVLLANLEVTGERVTAAQSAEHTKVVRQWMDSLQPALITAITDKDVVGPLSSS